MSEQKETARPVVYLHLINKIKQKYPETKGLSATSLVDWALRLLLENEDIYDEFSDKKVDAYILLLEQFKKKKIKNHCKNLYIPEPEGIKNVFHCKKLSDKDDIWIDDLDYLSKYCLGDSQKCDLNKEGKKKRK